jgi:phosphonate transport system ATP-binding protein
MDASASRSAPAAAQELAAAYVEVERLGKRLGAREVLHDLSLRVRAREFAAVLGPSGAGKTTLLRCVAGLLAPDRGVVRLGGTDVRELRGSRRRRVAVVFQQFNLVGRISALANVLAGRLGYVPAWRGITHRFSRGDRLFALQCLERVGLLDHAGQRADRLSGGQQQRVAIARALAQQPELIVADEPVASLDPANGSGVLELLKGICRDEGVALLCSLHQIHYARRFADHVIGMDRGRVLFDVAGADFDEYKAEALYGQLR